MELHIFSYYEQQNNLKELMQSVYKKKQTNCDIETQKVGYVFVRNISACKFNKMAHLVLRKICRCEREIELKNAHMIIYINDSMRGICIIVWPIFIPLRIVKYFFSISMFIKSIILLNILHKHAIH